VEIKVLQGGARFTGQQKSGTFHLDGIPPARAVFRKSKSHSTSRHGICTFPAKDLGTGKEQKSPSPVRAAEQGRKCKDAAGGGGARRRRQKAKEAIEIKNNADTLAYQSEKQLNRTGRQSSGRETQTGRGRDRRGARSDQQERYRRDQAWLRRLAEQVPGHQRRALQTSFRASWPAPGPQPGPEAGGRPGTEQGAGKRRRDGDVVDAEFEVVAKTRKK